MSAQFRRSFVAALAALVMSSVAVGSAVGPAQAVASPVSLVIQKNISA